MEDWHAGGHYSQLSEGLTHWRREGPPGGVPIVLVHGATVPCWEFDAQGPALWQAGFQTLRFDLYGHGRSDRPAGAYTFERFTRQVIEVIEATSFPRPAILLGHSFGAALVAAVAAARADLASRLVLVAPMLDFSSSSRWTAVFRRPLVGECAMHFIALPALVRRRRRRYAAIGRPHLTSRFIEQASQAGYGRALLSMLRTGALGDQAACYSALHSVARDVLVITGEHDRIIPAAHVARLRTLLPRHAHHSIPGDHSLLLTHPDAVAHAIGDWYASAARGPRRTPDPPR